MTEMAPSENKNSLDSKREHLAQLLESRRRAPNPLSFGQEALWFEEHRAAGSPLYNISVALRILSPIQIPLLNHAVDELVTRHDQLRSRFPSEAGSPQTVTDVDGTGLFLPVSMVEEDEDTLRAWVNQAAQEPFDLEYGPLIRVRLYSVAEADHILLLVVHHIVADGWSLWLILEELQALYAALIRGERANLETPGATYDDFIYWQRQLAKGEKWSTHRDFWMGQFAGDRPVLDLPSDRPRPEMLSFHGAVERFELEPELLARLRRLGHDQGVTPVSLLMAAFQVLLFRLTHQETFVVGLPSMGRGLTPFAGVVGYFVNLMPIRAQLDGKIAFRDLLNQVHDNIRLGLAHQDYPFPHLVRDLKLDRDPSRTPVFETAFVYNRPQRQEMQEWAGPAVDQDFTWAGLPVTPYVLETVTSNYDLTLSVLEQGDSLLVEFVYSSDLFDRQTIYHGPVISNDCWQLL